MAYSRQNTSILAVIYLRLRLNFTYEIKFTDEVHTSESINNNLRHDDHMMMSIHNLHNFITLITQKVLNNY